MVTNSQSDGAPATAVLNRGFVPDETLVAVGPGSGTGWTTAYYRPFWRPVVAGAVFAITTFVLSWYLMLGCGVGVGANGAIVGGSGEAVWLCVTACIAFFFGGMIAGAIPARSASGISSSGSGVLKGAVLWGVAIPLALLLYATLSRGALAGLNLPVPTSTSPTAISGATGAQSTLYWGMFVGLALALIFSLIGGAAGSSMRRDRAIA